MNRDLFNTFRFISSLEIRFPITVKDRCHRMTISRVGLFISTNQLREKLIPIWKQNRLGTDLRVLDSSYNFDDQTDGYKDFYQQGHISSALYLNPLQCVKKTTSIPFDLPDVQCFTDYLQSLGISPNTHIVTYDRMDTRAALRAWWMLRLHGVRNISVLDGGLKKWVRDGYPITTEEPVVERGSFKAEMNPALMKNYNNMKDSLNGRKEELIDSRGGAAFDKTVQTESGEEIKNHIPGAKNIPFPNFFNEDGTFKSTDDLRTVFKNAGVDPNRPLIGMCNRGILGCAVLAAAELMGKTDTPLYYGSWMEWSQKMVQ